MIKKDFKPNRDQKTIDSFGQEWQKFDQNNLSQIEINKLFNRYFNIFPWITIGRNSEGFDMGSGSGRWA